MVYVNPTFLVPQIVGGLIFGLGFVMGGYCPGTACVASSTGKLDGIVHIVGMMLGILLFGEAFPLFSSFYNSTSMGQVTFPQILHISYGLAVFLIVLLALAGFVVAERIEKKFRPANE